MYKGEHKHASRNVERDFSISPMYTAVHELKASSSSRKHTPREVELPYLKPLPKPPKAGSCHRSKHKRKQIFPHHLQKHHSDESLASYAAIRWSDGQTRAHSSADEISSLNHSPSVSSSDESFSKTTDASPSPSPPIVHDSKRWLFVSGVNPCSSPEVSPHHTYEHTCTSPVHSASPYKNHQDASGSRNREKVGSGYQNRTSSSRRKEKISQEALMALAMAEGNTTSDSTNCLSALDSYQGDTCTSFEYKRHTKRRRNKHSIVNLDRSNRIAKYLGHEKRKQTSKNQDEQAQMLTAKKDSSSQTDLKIPHCVSSLLSKNGDSKADIEKKIMEIFEEQDMLQNMSDNDLLKGYSDDSLMREMKNEKTDDMKTDPYDFEVLDINSQSRFIVGLVIFLTMSRFWNPSGGYIDVFLSAKLSKKLVMRERSFLMEINNI